MKRILRFLARLYPSSWRHRYGAEFDALLDDVTPTLRDGVDILMGALEMQITKWDFSGFLLAGSLLGLLGAGAILTARPTHYVSQSVIELRPDDQSALNVIDNLDRDILSRESLAVLIQEHNLYARERVRMPLDSVIEKMGRDISVRPVSAVSPWSVDSLTFAIAFDYPDARVAQQVCAELTSAFLAGALDSAQRRQSRSVFRVLDPPNLPRKPVAPNRSGFVAGGLTAGLLAGFMLALVMRSRRSTTVCPTCGQRTQTAVGTDTRPEAKL